MTRMVSALSGLSSAFPKITLKNQNNNNDVVRTNIYTSSTRARQKTDGSTVGDGL
jgi:hypothetical protein